MGTTRYLDEFAAENVLFKRAFSPATWTIPTHASMLTGLYRLQLGEFQEVKPI
jgi:arylsulfatase A-like enzyme